MIKFKGLKTGDILEVKHEGKRFLVYYLDIYKNNFNLVVSKIKGTVKEILIINRDEVIKKYE